MDIFDDQEFYELMQNYRHTRMVDQDNVVLAFGEVKTFIREQMEQDSIDFGIWLGNNLKKNKGKNIDELYKDFKDGKN